MGRRDLFSSVCKARHFSPGGGATLRDGALAQGVRAGLGAQGASLGPSAEPGRAQRRSEVPGGVRCSPVTSRVTWASYIEFSRCVCIPQKEMQPSGLPFLPPRLWRRSREAVVGQSFGQTLYGAGGTAQGLRSERPPHPP